MYYLIKGVVHSRENPDEIEARFSWAVNGEEEKEKETKCIGCGISALP